MQIIDGIRFEEEVEQDLQTVKDKVLLTNDEPIQLMILELLFQ